MRKLIGIALTVALSLTALAAVPVTADPDGTNPNAAVLIRGDSCGFFDSNGDLVEVVDARWKIVDNGNVVTVKCWAEGVFNDTGRAVNWEYADFGIPCSTVTQDPTDDWRQTLSASGRTTLTCRVAL